MSRTRKRLIIGGTTAYVIHSLPMTKKDRARYAAFTIGFIHLPHDSIRPLLKPALNSKDPEQVFIANRALTTHPFAP